MKWLLSEICTFIFILAEDLHINMRGLTPWVIAGMMGAWLHKVESDEGEQQ